MQISDGRRVMGTGQNVIANKTAVPGHLIFEVPSKWSLAEAATMPVAYLTAYYALIMRGRLQEGMQVLIHSACGAVGLACVNICLSRKAEVHLDFY